MNLLRKFLSISIAGITLSACASSNVSTDTYVNTQPAISVKDFYSKPVEGYGFYQNNSGEVKDRYYATLVPSWHGNEGTIIEKQWNDKGKLFFQQQWKIHVSDDGHNFTATATKLQGVVKGETRGYAMHMQYILLAPQDDGSDLAVDADDWTYLQPDGSGLNKVSFSKYGFAGGVTTYDLHPLGKGENLHAGYFE